ncbi:MAG: hypothetical protein M3Q20_03075 [Actinomycetota bacterium]|nr:hypothetical protein [Actinomycetota bacterium]
MTRKLIPEVERWLRETNPPLEPPMRRVAEVVLGADQRMTAYLKHGTVQFAYEGDLTAFVQPKGKRVSLMFNRGAKIPGDFPSLEGDGPTARFMRFADLAEVEERADELTAITRAWCAMQTKDP